MRQEPLHDRNPCTTDICGCGDVGCVTGMLCFNVSVVCPNPDDTCDPATGCPSPSTSTTTTTLQLPTTGPCKPAILRSFLYIRPAGTGHIFIAGESTEFNVGDIAETDANGEAVLNCPRVLHLLLDPSSACMIVEAREDGSVRRVGVLQGFINFWLSPGEPPPRYPFEAATGTVVTTVKGTAFGLGYDPSTQVSPIAVAEHAVDVAPTNGSLPPFSLNAGQQVQVGPDRVSPVTSLPLSCAPSSGTSKKAGRAVTLKVKCASSAATAQTVSVTGASASCSLVRPVSRSVPPHKRRSFKVKVRCQAAGEFFVLTGDGLPG